MKGHFERRGKGYLLSVASNHSVTSWNKVKPIAGTAESVAQGLAPSDWKRLSAGDGVKGPRLHDWAYVELADIDASDYGASRSGLWTRGLLIRRTITDHELAPPRLQQEPLSRNWCVWRAAAGPSMATIRCRDQPHTAVEDTAGLPLIRWSIQEIRRIATRLAQKAHRARAHHRLVRLAKVASGRRQGAS